ncbi:hypothetical protein CFAEC_03640 [Corynebacterium faecale]|uniref:septation protein SepH n=1 Tax=Corynebacterium faecale TaxID=1758466 RepID=UPI0025B48971|nr:septation protein SepH [Corynebacterium faecale]WJY91577.1 hypothetical protein CFAEC_03640 [Corynebacterium faecale]
MREIFLVSGDSTESSLVFKSSAEDGAEEFFIAVTDDLRAIVSGIRPAADEDLAGRDWSHNSSETSGGTERGSYTVATGPTPSLSSVDGEDHTGENVTAPAAETGAEAAEGGTDRVEGAAGTPGDSPAVPTPSAGATPLRHPREEREIDPRISAPLTMPPREIQARIRSGATIVELAEENGVTEARIEPYAHPVLLERARIAELAKQSHPVRENGPAKLTLWEILATAFATRGHDLTTARWDAYRDASNQWIVRVDWKAGLSDNHAEWSLNLHNTSSPTSDPRTPVAADLIDPEFIQPVRTLTSIGGGQQYAGDHGDHSGDSWDDSEPHGESSGNEDTTDGSSQESTQDHRDGPEHDPGDGSAPEPGAEDAPRNRRRKAVTPHWEDVLLGVRANTRRPKK